MHLAEIRVNEERERRIEQEKIQDMLEILLKIKVLNLLLTFGQHVNIIFLSILVDNKTFWTTRDQIQLSIYNFPI